MGWLGLLEENSKKKVGDTELPHEDSVSEHVEEQDDASATSGRKSSKEKKKTFMNRQFLQSCSHFFTRIHHLFPPAMSFIKMKLLIHKCLWNWVLSSRPREMTSASTTSPFSHLIANGRVV